MIRTLGCALLCMALATPVLAGPAWISIEYPANPHHPSTRGAALLVRAYHHSTALDVPVHGTLEGIIDGRRVSRPLELGTTSQRGVFAVRTPLPTGGTWVLAIHLRQGNEDGAGALVTLDARGRIVNVDVPSSRSRDGWVVPRALQERDIDAALRVASAAAAAPGLQPSTAAGVVGLVGLPLLLLGAGIGRARRTH